MFCTCLILVIKSSGGSWGFNRNTITTPTVNIIPETEHNFIYLKYEKEYLARPYVDAINTFLDNYKRSNADTVRNCNFNNPPPENSVCVFDTRDLDYCYGLTNFGYSKGSPCIFFTLSNVSY